jgi:N-acetylglucosamine malate deacetylase 2
VPVTVCAVFAHPDDESFGVAGTLAGYAARGISTALICATRGEAGMTQGLADNPQALAAVRTAELACAAQAMGLTDLTLLDFPDGAGATWDRTALTARLSAELRRLAPAVIITFDAAGVTRHPDHMVLHEVTRQVVTGAGAESGIRRLYYQVVICPREASPEGPSLACVPPESVDINIDISSFEGAKRMALRCHSSQAADAAHLLDQPQGSLTCEHYVLGWSVDGWRPTPGETDLLAGL